LTREPGGTELGHALRELLLNTPGDKSPQPLTELLLYAADRAQHISQVIQPAINNGDWVLSDRFSGSTLAYQGYGRGLNIKIIHQLELIALQDIVPDITIWLDISLNKSIQRRNEKPKDRIESEGETFLRKVSLGFKEIALNRNWIGINGDLESNIVSRLIEEEITKNLED